METLNTNLLDQSFAGQTQAPETKQRTIAVLAYPGVEVLDVAGPLEVFSFANLWFQYKEITKKPAYKLKVLAEKPGLISTMSGLQIIADAAYNDYDDDIDTLVIPGGLHDTVLSDKLVMTWIQAIAPRVRRLSSVCTGAFLLAESGLLDGRRATTH
jgi:transcriptional regulator GlxA family with amidase domain